MDSTQRELRRDQLDRQLAALASEFPQRPKRGWLATIREALGMSMDTVARRLKETKQNVSKFEASERADSITVKRLRQAADALNCDLIYALVPRVPLSDYVLENARRMAAKDLDRVNASMSLEHQALDGEAIGHLTESAARKLIEGGDQRIWQG